MAGKGISGLNGDCLIGPGPVFTKISEVKKWSCTMKANVAKYCSNKTGGYKKAVTGAHDGNGSMDCVWDPAIPATGIFEEGDYVTLNLQTTATQFVLMPAAIANIKIDVDMDNGDPITWNCDFESNEQWTNAIAIAPLLPPGMGGGDQPELTPEQQAVVDEARKLGLGDRLMYGTPTGRRAQGLGAMATEQQPQQPQKKPPHVATLTAQEFKREFPQASTPRTRQAPTVQPQKGISEEDIERIVREVMGRLAA